MDLLDTYNRSMRRVFLSDLQEGDKIYLVDPSDDDNYHHTGIQEVYSIMDCRDDGDSSLDESDECLRTCINNGFCIEIITRDGEDSEVSCTCGCMYYLSDRSKFDDDLPYYKE